MTWHESIALAVAAAVIIFLAIYLYPEPDDRVVGYIEWNDPHRGR